MIRNLSYLSSNFVLKSFYLYFIIFDHDSDSSYRFFYPNISQSILFISLSISLFSICFHRSLYFRLNIYLSIFICLSFYLSISISFFYIYPSISLSIYLFLIYLFIYIYE